MTQFQLIEPTPDSVTDHPKSVIFHARDKLRQNALAGKLDFVNLLCEVFSASGYQCLMTDDTPATEAMAAANLRHIHIVMGDRPFSGRNILFSVPAYLRGFWYLDELGTRNNSSLRTRPFNPNAIGEKHAQKFHARLVDEFVVKNRSKFDQSFEEGFTPKHGAICIFAQDFLEPAFHKHHLTFPDLIEGVIANRQGRTVYVKPHPGQSYDEAAKLMSYHAPEDGIEVTTHSIHGLLAVASVAVTLTSAVAFEANLHRVPAILAGQTDFHHNAITITKSSAIKSALELAETREFHFEKFLVWFLNHGLVRPKHRAAAIARIESALCWKGYPIGQQAQNGLF